MKNFFISFSIFLVFTVFAGCSTTQKSENLTNQTATQNKKTELTQEQNQNEQNTTTLQKKSDPSLSFLKLPENFIINTFAENLKKVRVLTFDPKGNLAASITDQGKIVVLPDKNNDQKADEVITILGQLKNPHGFLFRCQEENCKLYVAETHQVVAYDYNPEKFQATNPQKILNVPEGGRHFTRTLHRISTDEGEKLLISIGSSCDVCFEKDERNGSIMVANFDGSDAKIFASGLRNSVFLATHPVTGKIWATEMGRDWLGNDLPPDEVNILEEGRNYGWPVCYGKNVHDTSFDKKNYLRKPCLEPFETPSHIDLPAHVAPLGLAFIPEEGWPEEYWHDLLVAYHGSWNKNPPSGYKIARFKLDENGKYEAEENFIDGWLENGKAKGRPVDILIQPGGIFYISDDMNGKIYKVSQTHF